MCMYISRHQFCPLEVMTLLQNSGIRFLAICLQSWKNIAPPSWVMKHCRLAKYVTNIYFGTTYDWLLIGLFGFRTLAAVSLSGLSGCSVSERADLRKKRQSKHQTETWMGIGNMKVYFRVVRHELVEWFCWDKHQTSTPERPLLLVWCLSQG